MDALIPVERQLTQQCALQTVILETEVARKATKDIMTMHCIPKDRSADLLTEADNNAMLSSAAETAA